VLRTPLRFHGEQEIALTDGSPLSFTALSLGLHRPHRHPGTHNYTGNEGEPDTSDARIPALRAWLVSQRIGPYLELHELARGPFATFHVEWRSRRDRRVDALSLPAVIRIIDAAVEAIPLSRLN
jgi:hypothetical protein